VYAKLSVRAGQVSFDGAQCDGQALGDLLVGPGLDQETEHLPLPLGNSTGIGRQLGCLDLLPLTRERANRARERRKPQGIAPRLEIKPSIPWLARPSGDQEAYRVIRRMATCRPAV